MRATAIIEAAGVPAVPLVSAGFQPMAEAIAAAYGVPGIPLAVYPGVVHTDSDEAFAAKAREHVAPQALAALGRERRAAADVVSDGDEPGPRDVVARGDLDAILERFLAEGWSDGLPIVPPTHERVERFLRFTDRDRDEILGVLPPDRREATVWSVAVNGVMAGCRPEYLPLLIAVVEAIADPEFRLEDAGSTPGWEPLVVVSGTIAAELGFNSGTGAMRVGRQANTSVGRFLRLYMRNIAGLRIPPGDTDHGAIGAGFNVALAEDDEAVRRMGWEPLRVDLGFGLDDDVVMVQSMLTASTPIYSAGDRAEDHFEAIAVLLGEAMASWCFLGLEKAAWHPLVVLCPSIAAAIAADGHGKGDLRQYLYDHVWTTARGMERYSYAVGLEDWSLETVVREGRAGAEYAASADPDRPVRMLLRPEWTSIVVAGSPARNQSRAYVNNHSQGRPVARAIVRRPRS